MTALFCLLHSIYLHNKNVSSASNSKSIEIAIQVFVILHSQDQNRVTAIIIMDYYANIYTPL